MTRLTSDSGRGRRSIGYELGAGWRAGRARRRLDPHRAAAVAAVADQQRAGLWPGDIAVRLRRHQDNVRGGLPAVLPRVLSDRLSYTRLETQGTRLSDQLKPHFVLQKINTTYAETFWTI